MVKINYETTITVPPNSIKIPLVECTVIKFTDWTIKNKPFGIVNTELFWTITLPLNTSLFASEQEFEIIQSPVGGGEHEEVMVNVLMNPSKVSPEYASA